MLRNGVNVESSELLECCLKSLFLQAKLFE